MSSTPKRCKYSPSTSRASSERIKSKSKVDLSQLEPVNDVVSPYFLITLPKFSLLIRDDITSFKFAREKGLIAPPGKCPNCDCPMQEFNDKYKLGEIEFRCVSCRKRQSPLTDTIFEQTKTSLRKILLLIYCFCKKEPVCSTAIECELDRKTACHYYDYFRWICAAVCDK
jgi:transposase-like protein